MTTVKDIDAFACICDAEDRVVDILRDAFRLSRCLGPGIRLTQAIAVSDVPKAERFFTTLHDHQAVFDWQLNVRTENGLTPLHFAGAAQDENFVVLAAPTRSALVRLNSELVYGRTQPKHLRMRYLDPSAQASQAIDRDSQLYDELSRLNNELSTLQRDLAKKNVELERLDRLKNEFLGMAAHDLRSPLNVVLTYIELLEAQLTRALTNEQREFITAIKANSQYMLRLIDRTLDIASIEAGRLELHCTRVNLKPIVQRNIAFNQLLAAKRHVKLELTMDEDLPMCSVDETRIEQALNNVVDNAIKFSPQGSTVNVRVSWRDNLIVIDVEDQGEGITASMMSQLFAPFVTGERQPAGRKGVGLGLAIVRRIVDEHGGHLTAERRSGGGSRISLLLPCNAGERSPAWEGPVDARSY